VPLGKKNFKIRGSLPNPPKTCAELFAKYLNKNGIAVANDVIETSKNGRDITMVFDYYSPSYAEIVAYANQTSNNIYVESIYKYLGYKKYKIGTFETGSQAINDYLRLHNL
jgi:D-alanyl-D-alanine carboxypeptidase/D-alanyl-D-alanine-endopeptidase (penicillin-binding protein 4)